MTRFSIKGFFRVQTINKHSGRVTWDSGFFPNLILTSGKNIMATQSDWMNYCQVGTNNTAPLAAHTALLGYFAGTSTLSPAGTVTGVQGSPPYYGWKRKVFRFAAGTVAANLSEVGVGWGTSGSTLISRALILDPVSQLPTTITPLIDELLDVTYELRYYPPLVDAIGPQITLAGVVYDTITRAASVTSGRWATDIGTAIGQYSPLNSSWSAYTGAIGSILTGPSGVAYPADNANHYNSAYSSNSYQIQMNCFIGSTGWNAAGGIRSILIQTTAGEYQTQFTAAIGGAAVPKTGAYNIAMSWTLGWGELPPAWVAGTYALNARVTHVNVQWRSDMNNNISEPGIANWTAV